MSVTRLPVRALLLDLDDTILDNRSGIRVAWRETAAMLVRAHPDLSLEQVLRQVSRSTRWFWSDPEREVRGRLDLPQARREIIGNVLGELGYVDPHLVRTAADQFTELREGSYRLIDGAIAALSQLRERVACMALITNGASIVQRDKIARFSLARFFDYIQVEGEFGAGKPEPRVFEHALSQLQAAPEESLMVGDNFEADVLGALHVGMHAAWIDAEGKGTPPRPAPRQHITLLSMVELVDLIEP